MTYFAKPTEGEAPRLAFDSAEEAVAWARLQAKRFTQDYQVFKWVETHYIKAPVVPEPEVIERGVVE